MARAAAMSPEDRRASVVRATLPLVRRHGREVTTRQIAEAAGVAEGTLFRVFEDKDAILRAVVEHAWRPEPVLARLDALDTRVPLADFVTALMDIMSGRVGEIFEVAMAARWVPESVRRRRPERNAIELRIIELLRAYADELTVPPETVADVLRLLVFSSTHPLINGGRALERADLVDVLLNGVRGDPPDAPAPDGPQDGIPSARGSGLDGTQAGVASRPGPA